MRSIEARPNWWTASSFSFASWSSLLHIQSQATSTNYNPTHIHIIPRNQEKQWPLVEQSGHGKQDHPHGVVARASSLHRSSSSSPQVGHALLQHQHRMRVRIAWRMMSRKRKTHTGIIEPRTRNTQGTTKTIQEEKRPDFCDLASPKAYWIMSRASRSWGEEASPSPVPKKRTAADAVRSGGRDLGHRRRASVAAPLAEANRPSIAITRRSERGRRSD